MKPIQIFLMIGLGCPTRRMAVFCRPNVMEACPY